MSTFNDVVRKFKEMESEIVGKGGKVIVAHTNPSPDELIAGVKSIETNRPTITAANGYAIIVAERAGTTIKLYYNDTELVNEITIGSGGYITLSVDEIGQYTARAYVNDEEIWHNSVSVTEPGVYNIKSGLPLESYSWEEINDAAKNDYAKYMFNLWDTKKLSSFMGNTTATYITAHIIGFGQDTKVDGGKAGITFMLEQTKSTYKHHSTAGTNDNGVSWVGSMIRQNCLKSGEDYYVFDKSVTAETSGTYYVFDDVNNTFIEQTLPANFVSGAKYYTKTTLAENGAFIAGLPEEMLNYLVKVKKKTWAGYGGDVTSDTLAKLDNKIIVTEDWMFAPSSSEIFGSEERMTSTIYDKRELEGEQYQAFREYRENRYRLKDRWFRNPFVASSNSFCLWLSSGYVNYSYANSGNSVPLCFCL